MNILKIIWAYIMLYLIWWQPLNKNFEMKSFTVKVLSWFLITHIILRFETRRGEFQYLLMSKKKTAFVKNWLNLNVDFAQGYFNATFYDHNCGIFKNIFRMRNLFSLSPTFKNLINLSSRERNVIELSKRIKSYVFYENSYIIDT